MPFFQSGCKFSDWLADTTHCYSRLKQKPQRQVENLRRKRSGRREKSKTRPYILSLLTRPPTTVSSKKFPLSNSSVRVFSLNVSKLEVPWLVLLFVTLRMKDQSSGSYITLRSSSTVSLKSAACTFMTTVLTGFFFLVARATASD
jgi:hypothetical protein